MQPPIPGEVWFCDCEWGYSQGRIGYETAFEPVVFCLVGCHSKERHYFWGRDPGLKAFMEEHNSDTFVSHVNIAEMSYLIRFAIALPESWWDTYVGWRVLKNRPGNLEAGLLSALDELKLPHISPFKKDEIRARILNLDFDASDPAARREIIDYCFRDCDDCGLVYERIVGQVDPVAMTGWCRYLAAISRMELRGIPVNAALAHVIWLSGADIIDYLFEQINEIYPVFKGWVFSRKRFLEWASSAGIGWPWRSNDRGRLVQSLDDATFKSMSAHDPFIGLVRQVRKTSSTMGRRRIAFDGRSNRHHFSTWPFRSITGRNQPKNFIFTGPKWMRHLIVPESPDHALIYVDYVAEEIGIAAHLSGDPAMRAMYESDDAHLAFAKMAGAVPIDAIRDDYDMIRDMYKSVSLGALYSMTEYGISQRLNIPLDEATRLLNQHRELFEVYWAWSRRYVQRAFDLGKVRTKFGWECSVPPGSKFRTWANWPVQATGGDLMRLTVTYLDQQWIKLLAPVHDGFLISARKSEVEQVRRGVDLACGLAVRQILGNFPLRWDWTRYDEKFDDKKGREVWAMIGEALTGLGRA
jgi:DNA polymerase I